MNSFKKPLIFKRSRKFTWQNFFWDKVVKNDISADDVYIHKIWYKWISDLCVLFFSFLIGFTPFKSVLNSHYEKKAQKNYSIQKICLERTESQKKSLDSRPKTTKIGPQKNIYLFLAYRVTKKNFSLETGKKNFPHIFWKILPCQCPLYSQLLPIFST